MALNRAMTVGRLTTVLTVIGMSLNPGPLTAQDQGQSDGNPWWASFSHYGRWGALGAAVAFTAAAAVRQNDADEVFTGLNDLCRANSNLCRVDIQGRYVSEEAETLFQETLRLDGQARRFLIGAQASILASGVMFLVDLIAGDNRPENIPLTPFELYHQPNRMGLKVPF